MQAPTNRAIYSDIALLVILCGAMCPKVAHAEQPFFMGLPGDPGSTGYTYDISNDGSILLLDSGLWSPAGGLKAFPSSFHGRFLVSNGTAVIGYTASGNTSIWSRWTANGGFEPLLNFNLLRVNAASADGSVLVGDTATGTGRWTPTTGTEEIFVARSRGISADGTLIIGYGTPDVSLGGLNPFLWKDNTTVQLPNPIGHSGTLGVSLADTSLSDDGTAVTGRFYEPGIGTLAFRWTEATGTQILGGLPDGVHYFINPGDLTPDGSTIVGNDGTERSVIWDVSHGSRFISTLLTDESGLGQALTGWTLETAKLISADGRTISGRGTNPSGQSQRWVAYLGPAVPEPSTLLLAALALLPLAGRRRILTGDIFRPSNVRNALLACALAALLGGSSASGVTLDWTRQLASTDRSSDLGTGVSADGFGNVYFAVETDGNLGGTHVGDWDTYLTKYNAAGNQEWARKLGTIAYDQARGVSADGLGSIYLAGVTYGNLFATNGGSSDPFVIKYDADGNQQWGQQLSRPSADFIRGVSSDKLGNIFLAGGTDANDASHDAFLAKYDAAGDLIWTRQLGTPGHSDGFEAVAADGLGNAYVGGFTNGDLAGANAGGSDAFLSKYDAVSDSILMRTN